MVECRVVGFWFLATYFAEGDIRIWIEIMSGYHSVAFAEAVIRKYRSYYTFEEQYD